jgi:hypothetical protein
MSDAPLVANAVVPGTVTPVLLTSPVPPPQAASKTVTAAPMVSCLKCLLGWYIKACRVGESRR